VRHFTERQYEPALAAIESLFAGGPRTFGQQARQQLLADKVDVTEWMTTYFERHFGLARAAASAA
jgi:hypothetical protein